MLTALLLLCCAGMISAEDISDTTTTVTDIDVGPGETVSVDNSTVEVGQAISVGPGGNLTIHDSQLEVGFGAYFKGSVEVVNGTLSFRTSDLYVEDGTAAVKAPSSDVSISGGHWSSPGKLFEFTIDSRGTLNDTIIETVDGMGVMANLSGMDYTNVTFTGGQVGYLGLGNQESFTDCTFTDGASFQGYLYIGHMEGMMFNDTTMHIGHSRPGMEDSSFVEGQLYIDNGSILPCDGCVFEGTHLLVDSSTLDLSGGSIHGGLIVVYRGEMHLDGTDLNASRPTVYGGLSIEGGRVTNSEVMVMGNISINGTTFRGGAVEVIDGDLLTSNLSFEDVAPHITRNRTYRIRVQDDDGRPIEGVHIQWELIDEGDADWTVYDGPGIITGSTLDVPLLDMYLDPDDPGLAPVLRHYRVKAFFESGNANFTSSWYNITADDRWVFMDDDGSWVSQGNDTWRSLVDAPGWMAPTVNITMPIPYRDLELTDIELDGLVLTVWLRNNGDESSGYDLRLHLLDPEGVDRGFIVGGVNFPTMDFPHEVLLTSVPSGNYNGTVRIIQTGDLVTSNNAISFTLTITQRPADDPTLPEPFTLIILAIGLAALISIPVIWYKGYLNRKPGTRRKRLDGIK